MNQAGTGRFWPLVTLVFAVLVIPFALAQVSTESPLLVALTAAAILGVVWFLFFYTRVKTVPKEAVVIRKGPGDHVEPFIKGQYPYSAIIHSIEAVLPSYQLNFEFPIENIDTQTPNLARITRITVRVTCTITDHAAFYRKSAAFLDRIHELEEGLKLRRSDPALWRQILKELSKSLIDDSVRDVVWKWEGLRQSNPALVNTLGFPSLKNSDDDPYGLSLNRVNLARQVAVDVAERIQKNALGITLRPLVFESIEIDPEIIKRKTGDRAKEKEKVIHEASLVAAGILERGMAEAEVRSVTLAKLLDVLIKQYNIPHTDPLIAEVVRAALYSDGQMIWNGVIDKGKDDDAKGKDGDAKGK